MADLYWTGPKVSKEEIMRHMMDTANKRLPDFTHYGIRFDDSTCEMWVECPDVSDDTNRLWSYFDYAPKILGWRVIIIRCPIGSIDSGLKTFLEVGDAGVVQIHPTPPAAIKKAKKVVKKSI